MSVPDAEQRASASQVRLARIAPVLVVLLLAGCVGQPEQPPATGDPSSSPIGSATASPGPSGPDQELDETTASELLDRVAATGELVGLVEFELEYEPDEDDQPCGPPPPDKPLVSEVHYFGPKEPGLPEVHQATSVYRTDAAAQEALRHDFESLEGCRRSVSSGQVTTGYARASIPDGVELDARAVTATMTIPEGSEFPYQYGCVIRGPVAQCISVWTREATVTESWFTRAFVATSENLHVRCCEPPSESS